MSKKLAIRGHSARGKEVIELLQMMGRTNPFSKNDGIVIGNKTTNCYYISEDTASKYISWDYIGPEEIDKYEIFTLEEFLEKYPFKVGDKVADCYGDSITIKSMEWSEDCGTMVYDFEESEDVFCAEDIRFAYDTDDDTEQTKMKNVLVELLEHIKTTSKEELEREFKEIESEWWTNVGPTAEEFRAFCECVNRKPVYPKTYDECCKVLRKSPEFLIKYSVDGNDTEGDAPLIKKFIKLKRCRDAYWKIAGEAKVGLGKPWEPDWLDETTKYGIHVYQNIVIKDNFIRTNCVLVFPTPEIRDTFYDNFKDLIEECKTLL